jgi:hypothetical protein
MLLTVRNRAIFSAGDWFRIVLCRAWIKAVKYTPRRKRNQKDIVMVKRVDKAAKNRLTRLKWAGDIWARRKTVFPQGVARKALLFLPAIQNQDENTIMITAASIISESETCDRGRKPRICGGIVA